MSTRRVLTSVEALDRLPEGAVVKTLVGSREKTYKTSTLSEWDMVLDSREILDEGPVTLLDDGSDEE